MAAIRSLAVEHFLIFACDRQQLGSDVWLSALFIVHARGEAALAPLEARLASEVLGYDDDIEFAKVDVYDVGALAEKFDLVIFMGVLYHLRHPLLALDLIREHVAGDMLLFQSMQRGSPHVLRLEDDYEFAETGMFFESSFPKLHFIERQYAHDWTNWWVPNRACTEAMLRSAGFSIDKQIEEEVYLCRRIDAPPGAGAVYPAKEQRP